MNTQMELQLMDLPYDCLHYLVYNWCSVTTMHRKIKRLNVFFFELVRSIINSSKYNHTFIKKQQFLISRSTVFYQTELECRKRSLSIKSISLKWAIKKRFKMLNSSQEKSKNMMLLSSSLEKPDNIKDLNEYIEGKTKEKISIELRIKQLQKKLRCIKYTENRLKQNTFGPHFGWIMGRKGFYKIAEAGLIDFITFESLPQHHVCKLMDRKYHNLNLKYMFEVRPDDIAWCWVDNIRNTPDMLKLIDTLFKKQGNYTKFKPLEIETDVHCLYIRNDEPYFNQINRTRFV